VAAFTFFHTADLHNRLSPAAARRLADLKRRHEGALLLDAGDAIGAGNLTFRPGGEPILRRMAEIGYDAMTMGNRESHPLRRLLERKLRDAAFPVLAANMRSQRQPLPPSVRPHAIFDTAAGRVAVIGLAPQMTRANSLWSRLTDYVFDDAIATAEETSARLRGEVDVVICLSHCGERIDAEIAALEGVDLVLGGHTHAERVSQRSGQALVVHPGHHGGHVAQTQMTSREDARGVLLPLEERDD
jgi:2',3'-cyclic-nucleotide 2'-phosphodiesterase (5'-nucleotidase family)